MNASVRLAVGLLTGIPVKVDDVDRPRVGSAIALAPFVGLGLGLIASVVADLTNAIWQGPLLSAVLGIAAMAALTRGLHLDGLADTADGLGSGKSQGDALAIMKRSDIGPFGVITLVLVLLAQIAALTLVIARHESAGLTALLIPAMAGRLALIWACREGVPAAKPEGLGALVAGTIRRSPLVAVTLLGLLIAAGVALIGPVGVVAAVLAVAAALWVGELVRQLCVRRLGGITGDVLGAIIELATTAALLVLAV